MRSCSQFVLAEQGFHKSAFNILDSECIALSWKKAVRGKQNKNKVVLTSLRNFQAQNFSVAWPLTRFRVGAWLASLCEGASIFALHFFISSLAPTSCHKSLWIPTRLRVFTPLTSNLCILETYRKSKTLLTSVSSAFAGNFEYLY